jgi:hypothetical protein
MSTTLSNIDALSQATVSPALLYIPLHVPDTPLANDDSSDKENTPPGVLSPNTTASILSLHTNLSQDYLRSIAQGLIVTCNKCRRQHVMDLPQSTGQVASPGHQGHPSLRSVPIPIPKHACMHWAFCKKSGCRWHA